MAIAGGAVTVYVYTPTGDKTVTVTKLTAQHGAGMTEPVDAAAMVQRGETVKVDGASSGATAQLLRDAGYKLVQR